jgi:phosphoenolpyruvate-protein kinase (PTS system EI component)
MVRKAEKIFLGDGVSAGVVVGQALKLDSHNRVILKIHVSNAAEEVRRYQRAVEAAKEQLAALKAQLEEKLGSEHSVILDAHLLMLRRDFECRNSYEHPKQQSQRRVGGLKSKRPAGVRLRIPGG